MYKKWSVDLTQDKQDELKKNGSELKKIQQARIFLKVGVALRMLLYEDTHLSSVC